MSGETFDVDCKVLTLATAIDEGVVDCCLLSMLGRFCLTGWLLCVNSGG